MDVVRIFIQCENAAFDPEPGVEVARILRELAKRIESGEALDGHRLFDVNGNLVGHYEVGRLRKLGAR